MPLLLFFTIWTGLEIFVLLSVGSVLGAGLTFLLLMGSVVAGSYILRGHQSGFMMNTRTLEFTEKDAKEAMYRLLAALLLILPGFISDILALCLLVPALRKLVGVSLLKAFKPDVVISNFGFTVKPNNVYEHDGSVQAKREDGTVIQAELMDDKSRY